MCQVWRELNFKNAIAFDLIVFLRVAGLGYGLKRFPCAGGNFLIFKAAREVSAQVCLCCPASAAFTCALPGLGAHIQAVASHLVPGTSHLLGLTVVFLGLMQLKLICSLFQNPHFVEFCALSLDLITPEWWSVLTRGHGR